MTTYEGVRVEAEKRRMLKGDRVKLRPLTEKDFASYESLKQATGIDFRESDQGARDIGCSEENLAINAKVSQDWSSDMTRPS